MIKDYILLGCEENPNKILITFNEIPISYYSFNSNVLRFIKLIKSIRNNSRIFIDLESQIDVLYAVNACNRLGVIPILPPLVSKRIKGVDYYRIAKSTNILNKDCKIQYNGDSAKLSCYNESAIQCIIFTSGTTSDPKAVELTFGNIYSSAFQWKDAMKFNKDDIYLNILPLYHISGLSIFYRCLYFGMHHVIGRYKKNSFGANKLNINYISIVPKIINDAKLSVNLLRTLQKIKNVIIGGDAISESLFNFCKKNNINAYASYGMTETASGVSGYFIKNADNYEPGYIGNVHKDNEIKIIDNIINIKSRSVMKRYTSSKKVDGFFNTRDYGKKIKNRFYCQGRGRNFIISGGENINLNTIKTIVLSYPNVVDAVVSSMNHNIWGKVPVLIYSESNNYNSIKKIKIFCKNKLPKYMVPYQIIKIDQIPYKNNKIDYSLVDFYIKESLQ